MSSRRPTRPVAPRTSSYDDVVACEENGKHRVKPNMWPPPATGLEAMNPSLSLRCELCGTNCIVYAWHGEENDWIEVVKPTAKKATATA